MEYKREMIMLAVLSIIVIIFSAAGVVWAFASQLVFGGLDGILLLAVCLMMGGIFTLELWIVARQAGWVPSGASAKGAAKPTAAMSAPVTKSAAIGSTATPAVPKAASATAAGPPVSKPVVSPTPSIAPIAAELTAPQDPASARPATPATPLVGTAPATPSIAPPVPASAPPDAPDATVPASNLPK